jgi:uracil-DNA glycosylase
VKDRIIQLLREEAQWAGPFIMLPESESSHTKPERQANPDRDHMLEGIRKNIGCCTSCPLGHTRKNAVPGEGNAYAQVMFIGEAPGAVEDETGRPFVGPAGTLLTDIVEKGMGLKRKDVFIANILKCRPPANRDPQDNEVAACIGFLHAQISAVNPKVIVALGRIATHTLLADTTPISKLRGTFREFRGILTMPTYHPSYLLQNPSKKRDVWEDIKKVMEVLGISIQR